MIFRAHCLGCVSQFFVGYQVDQQALPGPDLRNETYFGSLSDQACLNLEMTHIYWVGILLPAVLSFEYP